MGIESWDCGGHKTPSYTECIRDTFNLLNYLNPNPYLRTMGDVEQGSIWSHCHENLSKHNSLSPNSYKEVLCLKAGDFPQQIGFLNHLLTKRCSLPGTSQI